LIHGKRENAKRECASLTKIMTCYLVIKLCKSWGLQIDKTEITVTSVASDIRGTTANLETGDILTVEQLLYGLMLPSGNDAAFALAQFFGKDLFKRKYKPADAEKIVSYQFNYHQWYAKYFLKEMNLVATKMGLANTHFDSPHGLMNIQNYSCAKDMCKLSAIAMRDDLFKKIVKTRFYECTAKSKLNFDERESPKTRKRKLA